MDFLFFLNSALLGVGLAMDAFSVSVADGIAEGDMKRGKPFLIAGTFSLFQFLMPLLGYLLVSTVVNGFTAFSRFIPYIALALLSFIGGKMIFESFRKEGEEPERDKTEKVGLWTLLVQGVATSIDALSVGFTIATYPPLFAVVASLVIAVVTFLLCLVGVGVGKKFEGMFQKRASLVGGIILVVIGLEIFLTGIL